MHMEAVMLGRGDEWGGHSKGFGMIRVAGTVWSAPEKPGFL